MKKLNEVRFTPELIKKIEECKSAEELVKLAADNDVELSLADAEKHLTKGSVMLSDDDMDKVAGGLLTKLEPDENYSNDSSK